MSAVGARCVDRGVRVAARIEGQVIAEVCTDAFGELFRARREECVCDLYVRALRAGRWKATGPCLSPSPTDGACSHAPAVRVASASVRAERRVAFANPAARTERRNNFPFACRREHRCGACGAGGGRVRNAQQEMHFRGALEREPGYVRLLALRQRGEHGVDHVAELSGQELHRRASRCRQCRTWVSRRRRLSGSALDRPQ